MLMIRFQRIGRKNDAAFRIVVTEKTSGPKSGKHVDLIGSYNPKTKAVSIDAEGVKKWISQGAQVSPSVHNLLIKEGIISGDKINVLPKKKPILKEPTEESAKEGSVAKEKVPTQQEDNTEQKENTQESAQKSVTESTPEKTPAPKEKEALPSVA